MYLILIHYNVSLGSPIFYSDKIFIPGAQFNLQLVAFKEILIFHQKSHIENNRVSKCVPSPKLLCF